MPEQTSPPWLRLMRNLRWLAVAGQALTVLVVTGPLGIELPQPPLWWGIAALALFNLYVTWRARVAPHAGAGELFAHGLVDILVLAWLVGWSGGVENPFSSLFLLPIALSVFALQGAWIWATAGAAIAGFALSSLFARPLPHVHGVFGDAFSLHKFGMTANFIVSAAVVLVFFTRMAAARRQSAREVARLREGFARNEGIIALATHAASVAHELNTPLGTLTLMVEDLASEAGTPARRDDYQVMRQLLEDCRDRVRDLASPADQAVGTAAGVDLERVIARWQLVRPTIELHRTGDTGATPAVDRAVGHLLLALLNNAADASEQAGTQRVDLQIAVGSESIDAAVRDYGVGLGEAPDLLPGTLFRTSKPSGMGIGLALSHATVERLGGTLSMQAATQGPGIVVAFSLPLRRRT